MVRSDSTDEPAGHRARRDVSPESLDPESGGAPDGDQPGSPAHPAPIRIAVLFFVVLVLAAVGIVVSTTPLHWIQNPLGAASLGATTLVAIMFVLSVTGLWSRGRRLTIDLDRDEFGFLLSPVLPFAAIVAGLLFGYFFW